MTKPPGTPDTLANLNYTAEEFLNNLGFTTRSPAELGGELDYGSHAPGTLAESYGQTGEQQQYSPWQPGPSWHQQRNLHQSGNALQCSFLPDTSPTSSPRSAKSITCYFWANREYCKWSDEDCLYAHYNTGKLSSAPLHIHDDCRAVAGRNASNPDPVYFDWRREHQKIDFIWENGQQVTSPEIQRQLQNIKTRYQVNSPTPVKCDHLDPNDMGHYMTRTHDAPYDEERAKHPPMASPRSAQQTVHHGTAMHQTENRAPMVAHHPHCTSIATPDFSEDRIFEEFRPTRHESGGYFPPEHQLSMASHGYCCYPSYINARTEEASSPKHTCPQPTVAHGNPNQYHYPRPSDHLNYHSKSCSTANDELLISTLVKNNIIKVTCQGLDSAIHTMMDVVRNTTNEIDKLVKLSKDETYTIRYAGPIDTDREPSEMLKTPFGHGGGQDYRQKLVGVAENLSHLMQMQVEEFKRLNNIQGRVANWMTGIGATSQLPEGWAK